MTATVMKANKTNAQFSSEQDNLSPATAVKRDG
jgi:hypothetical protein